jgi:hypothetical protein
MVDMRKTILVVALLLAASPAIAQVDTTNGQQQLGVQVPAAPSQTPTTGVICDEEATATFCNVPTGPNTGGYQSSGGSGSIGGAGSTAPTPSVPPCGAEWPANELRD